MIGVGTSLLFDRRAGKAGPPIPPFNKANGGRMVYVRFVQY